MNGIQILLVLAALLWLGRFLARVRSRGVVRALAVVVALSAVVLVVFPDISVRIAKLVGVARGVDVAIYFAIVALGFLALHLVARQNDLESKLVELTRDLALRELAAEPKTDSEPGRAAGRREP